MTNQPAKKASPRKTTTKNPSTEPAEQATMGEPRISIDVDFIGRWCFILGVSLAVAVALIPSGAFEIRWLIYPMLFFGILGGALRIRKSEELHFFAFAISLVVFQSVFQSLFQSIPTIGLYINQFFTTLMFFSSAVLTAVIVKNVFRWFQPS